MTWQPIETAPRDGTHVLLGGWDGVFGWSTEGRFIEHDNNWWALNNDPSDHWGRALEPTAWQPLPPPPAAQCDTAAFLARMSAAAEAGERVTADDVARLRKLADWADAPPAPGWNGTLDRGEAMRAIEAAERRMRDE